MKNSQSKDSKKSTVEELTSEEERKTLETQMKHLADTTRTALATTEDVRIEKIKTGTNGNERLAARARNGKFVSRTEASTIVAAKKTQAFLADVDKETGLSRHETLLNSLYDGAKVAAKEPRALGNSVKAVELIDELAGHRAAREKALEAKENTTQPISIVITAPILMHPETIDAAEEERKRKEREKRGPSFADCEVIQQNGPSGMPR